MCVINEEYSVASARDVAYAYLREQLVSGKVQPGEVLDDVTIARDVRISRTPVREALIQLEREGMVSAPARRRPKVADAEPGDLALILAPLGVLLALAAELATPRAGEADVALLRQRNQELLDAIAADDPAAAQAADRAFHHVLVDRAGNRFVAAEVRALEMHLQRVSSLYFHNRGPDGQSAREHEAIIEAVARGDAAGAVEATRSNYLRGLDMSKSSEES